MKVLVVDDDVVSRMVLMHLIDACGKFDILEAEDGEDAWQQMADGLRPAICFCDLRMPRLSGMDLLARVKSDSALGAMPFVLVTSANDSATVGQAEGLGVDGYLVKPFQGEQVKTYMAPFAPAPTPGAETAQATMQRLGINGERLLVYLGGFQAQLTSASGDIAALLAGGQSSQARVRLERLHAGCLTLGLGEAAAILRGFPEGTLDDEQVRDALGETVRAVMHQSEAVKRLQRAA
ncbi:response regulator [Massilia sp. TWP1-3-3]|uniref:response regulator n=1 Tax=Massilia sp. TWP1-3-3 TaxID=2804573 RepID=UPI003CF9647A